MEEERSIFTTKKTKKIEFKNNSEWLIVACPKCFFKYSKEKQTIVKLEITLE